MVTITLVDTKVDIMLFNRFCLRVKATFNVNGSYNDYPVKEWFLYEEKSIEYMG
ncbi:hypothetical protein [Candidatus Enterovibrio escicola]|uniref:hypothetical protein n=1 Tax=Candidatus Enterovibrio escicola TaxID=1927127 RepID=UPI001CC22D7A|nr:hypothetical protein [Candidatus Enterovibrio escacola]